MTWPEWVEHVSQFTVAKVVGWAVGITAVLLALTKVWPWLKAFVRMVDTIATLPTRLDAIEATQKAIKASQVETAKELTDNHGSSLKDAIKRTETLASDTQDKLDVHIEFCKQRERLLAEKDKK